MKSSRNEENRSVNVFTSGEFYTVFVLVSLAKQKGASQKNSQEKESGKPSLLSFTMYACATVIVTPDARRRIVFTRGRPHTSSTCVPNGGQMAPTATEGTRLK